MLKAIQRFYRNHIEPPADAITAREATEHALQLATAALLIEVTRADAAVQESERQAVVRAVRDTFQLSEGEARELIALAEGEADEATSLYQFTHLIDKGYSAEQKQQVVELLWRVVFADKEMEKHEEQLVRRVAGLIHVSHRAFIKAKLKVRDELAGG